MTSPYLTQREAIAYLRCGSASALYRLIREHALPYGRRGRQYLFDTRDLDVWIKTSGTAPAVVPARPRRLA